MPLSEYGKRRLEDVCQLILADPEVILMNTFSASAHEINTDNLKMPACETVGCIAGWVLARSLNNCTGLYHYSQSDIEIEACKLLGFLHPGDSPNDSERLFYPHLWPEDWMKKLDSTKYQTPEYAQVVVDYIHYFIANN